MKKLSLVRTVATLVHGRLPPSLRISMKRIRLALATFVLFPSVVFAQDGWKVIDQTRERSWYWYQPLGERAADGRAVVRLGVLYAAAQRVDSTLTSRHAEYVYHIRCAYMDYHLDFAYWHDADGKVVRETRVSILHWLWDPIPPNSVVEGPARQVCARRE